MSTKNPLRIGLMGGTFDPIHIGHLIMAENAYEQFQLDSVLFLPTGKPPHKQNLVSASDQNRRDMAALAIKENPHFELDCEEMERKGFTYTYETLQELKKKNPDIVYYFIIGADSLLSFDTWREPAKICKNCTLLAAVRDGLATSEMEAAMDHLRDTYSAKIHLLNSPNIDISSSMIRQRVKEGKSIRYHVTDSVLNYIEEHQLYKD